MKKLIIQLIILLISLNSNSAPPDYSFRNPVLISGTNLQVASKYRFSNVKSGTDAIVTIVQFTSGVTLTSLDDGSSGYPDAFQPYVVSPASSNGYAEFNIEFVNAGTLIPRIMTEVPVSLVDVDGDVFAPANLYEFDIVSLNPLGYYIDYDMVGTDLTINVIGNWVRGRNAAAINYPGIDTANKRVMFTVVNANISSFNVRLGAQNGSSASNNRRKSLYFAKFAYVNSFLPKKSITHFSGVRKENIIELKWQLENDRNITAVILERTDEGGTFMPITRIVSINGKSIFTYIDNVPANTNYFYRVKIEYANTFNDYSTILAFRLHSSASFLLYPNEIQSSATLKINSLPSGVAFFQLIDSNGHTVLQQKINVSAGTQYHSINNLSSLKSGYYVASLTTGTNKLNQKIYKR